ncbi:hypothetical protein, partial [Mesorhizobium sp.]|uniref:hypothetical protein n=1 Tax=Mesorhizobium sp. TaxID=1871066 RepID=UPI00257B388A
ASKPPKEALNQNLHQHDTQFMSLRPKASPPVSQKGILGTLTVSPPYRSLIVSARLKSAGASGGCKLFEPLASV